MQTKPLYRALADLIGARQNCEQGARFSPEWSARHMETADKLARDFLPCGSGFDSGTRIDWDRSTAECIVLQTAFHHMDAHGGYDGWTDHAVQIRASLRFGFTCSISGRDRNGFKDYAHEVFNSALNAEVSV